MMALLAKGAAFLLGKGVTSVTLPLLALSLLVSLHKNYMGWRSANEVKIETAATNQCNSSWKVALSKKAERDARAEAQAAADLIMRERELNERLANELEANRTEAALLRTKLDAGTPDKCLSDGVLSTLGRR